MKDTLKQDLVHLMGGECAVCGYKKCLAALHFHHINPFEKEFNISSKNNFYDLEKELEKVILLCSNCHAEAHQNLISPETLEMLKECL